MKEKYWNRLDIQVTFFYFKQQIWSKSGKAKVLNMSNKILIEIMQ
jgi:uncharacterized membrane protein